ncbi:Ribonuclease PH [Methanosarcina sp. MTP4]|uniref:exosome complex exonuclease Rrp41 n=1 Tax=Methanosarcina sp. MTP4 TaxID=1434100 RepID=UPI0006158E6B|nr:exosome complex exonuclease Rrp41 [Methanosarcina sp. MTP4]AKB25432.1 Ribonuclease PH [Methanosarcina sp. MTP4]
MSGKPEKLITDDGLRLDGRRMDEIRPMKIEVGVLSRADGSCYLEWGRNKILVGVYGPREAHPRRMQRPDSAVIRYRYNMAAFSVEDRARPGHSRRSIEISKVSRDAFEPVIMSELYPKAAIDIFVEVLQADAGTRTAAINASSVALADAGIPMKGLVTSCAFGKVDGQVVLDLSKDEDNYGDADFPVALTQDGEITLVQMDGHLTQDEIKKGLELVKKGCSQIFALQQAALRTKFEFPEAEEAEELEEEEAVEAAEAEISEVAAKYAGTTEVEEAAEADEVISEEEEAEESEGEAEESDEVISEEEEAEESEEESEEEAEESEEESEEEAEESEEESEEETEESEAESEEEAEESEEESEEETEESEEESEEEAEESEEESEEEAEEESFEEEFEAETEEEAEEELEADEEEEEIPAEELEEEAEEEAEGPWKVVKDPLDPEAGNGGENDE